MLLDSHEETTSDELGRFFTYLIIFGATLQSLQIKDAGTCSCFFELKDHFLISMRGTACLNIYIHETTFISTYRSRKSMLKMHCLFLQRTSVSRAIGSESFG